MAPPLAEFLDHSLKLVAVASKNSYESLLLTAAFSLYGLVSVPLYDTLGPQAMHYILQQTNISTLFLETKLVPIILSVHKSQGKSSLQNLVIMDTILLNNQKSLKCDLECLRSDFGVVIWNFEDLIDIG